LASTVNRSPEASRGGKETMKKGDLVRSRNTAGGLVEGQTYRVRSMPDPTFVHQSVGVGSYRGSSITEAPGAWKIPGTRTWVAHVPEAQLERISKRKSN
jgi:hypothetical protein